jgi:hypothetical protein
VLALNPSPFPRAARLCDPVNPNLASRVAGLSLLLAPLSVSWVSPAAAEPDAKTLAASHFARGLELANEGAYAEALIEFGRAYDTRPHYSVLYNMGQAYIGLGKPVQAVQLLRRYLNEGGAQIGFDRRREVEAEIVKQFARTGTVVIAVSAPDAKITIDGEPAGSSPLQSPVRLPIGVHRIRAELPTGEADELTLTVAGEDAHTIRLEPKAPPSAPAAPVSTSGWVQIVCPFKDVALSIDGVPRGFTPLKSPLELPPGTHQVSFSDAAHPQGSSARLVILAGQTVRADCGWPLTQASERTSRSTWGYVVGAVGLGLGGAAAAHFAWNLGRYHDWNDEYDAYATEPSVERRERANSLGASIERASMVTIALGLGAGLALGTGTLLLVTDGSATSKSGAQTRSTSLSWRGAF